ncbi:Permease of the drug/metabolite transporter (DMT) superfamily [Olavius algarvensis Delta 1 endosymbiont]|nr:Permease of the drug/metabolite transporter (DMT) superfamily [Olavius algarvensis Delta 1 endosymbiont]
MFPLALAMDAPWSIIPSPEAAAAVLGIAIISTAAAYLLYFRILAAAGATNVLSVTFLIPISALLLGVGVLGEVTKDLEYMGLECIFLGLIVIDGRVWQWAHELD